MDLARQVQEHLQIVNDFKQELPLLKKMAETCVQVLQKGGRLFFLGNGGSAADAQHLAAEFVGRFERDRQALPAVALTTDTSILTAVANDYSFNDIFSRQVQAWVKPGDAVFGISASGNSPNVVKALEAAKVCGAFVMGFTGQDGGKLKELCHFCLCVPSSRTARIQETHILAGHMICDWCEQEIDDAKSL